MTWVYQETLHLQLFNDFHLQASNMDILQYWPFACEYSIWIPWLQH